MGLKSFLGRVGLALGIGGAGAGAGYVMSNQARAHETAGATVTVSKAERVEIQRAEKVIINANNCVADACKPVGAQAKKKVAKAAKAEAKQEVAQGKIDPVLESASKDLFVLAPNVGMLSEQVEKAEDAVEALLQAMPEGDPQGELIEDKIKVFLRFRDEALPALEKRAQEYKVLCSKLGADLRGKQDAPGVAVIAIRVSNLQKALDGLMSRIARLLGTASAQVRTLRALAPPTSGTF